MLVTPISDYTRNIAILHGEQLVEKIERFKTEQGFYPNTLAQLEHKGKPKPGQPFIMGITGFRYNRINDQYSLSFSQWLECGSLEDIVLFDKNNLRNKLEGRDAPYNYDFDLCRVKGAFAVRATGYTGWTRYLID